MAQFDVYRNPNPGTRKTMPFLLDVQADLLDDLVTRVVVPLVAASERDRPAKHLNPKFKVEGKTVVMSTAELAGIPRKAMGEKITSLRNKREEIIAALDFLITGI